LKMIERLDDLVNEVKGAPTKTLAVAAGHDYETMLAVDRATNEGVVHAILVGDKSKMEQVAKEHSINLSKFEIINIEDEVEAAVEAVKIVGSNKADLLMKGSVKTAEYMKAILHREYGLLPAGSLLCHIAALEIPSYHKLLIISDAAIIPVPDLSQKIQLIKYTTSVARYLGIEMPKVAILSAVETVNSKIPSSVDAAIMTLMNRRKQIKGAVLDGPLALDVALSKEGCRIKGLESPVGGDADVLIFPNIEAANIFYKSTTVIAGGKTAAVVAGTKAPVVLTSRADNDDSKFYSIVLAAKLSEK